MSSSRPSRTFFGHSASAKSWRASRIASASPASRMLSATSGSVMRPTSSTGFVDTRLADTVYGRSQPPSYVIGVWMNEWWTPAETLT